MVDILDRDDCRQFRVWGRFSRFAEPITKWSEPAEPAPAIDEADIEMAEPNHVVPGFEVGDADEFSDQGLADEDKLALPLDLTCVADAANLMIGIIPGVFDPVRHGALRGGVKLRRRPLPERLGRTLLVGMPAKVIEADLAVGWVSGSWAVRLFLQGAMHALVPPILLRRSGADEVRFDAELEPPGRQPGQTARTGRPERCSIIAADRKREPI